MLVRIPFATLAVAGLALAGCAPEKAVERGIDEKAPAATVVGDAVDCVPLTQIRNSRVRSDYTIDFEMSGGRIYRNSLPYRCSGLGSEKSFTYSTSLSQLCSTDIITVLYTSTQMRGASCGLGPFVPVEYAEKETAPAE